MKLSKQNITFNSSFNSILIMLLSSFLTFGQTKNNMPSQFKEIKTPKPGTSEWSALNLSQLEFELDLMGDKLLINKVSDHLENELNLNNGILRGLDYGEWGGKLLFIPEDRSKAEIEIKNGNVKFVFRLNDKIYFIEGLAHLSISQGALYELEIKNETYKYKKIVAFDDAPEAMTIFENQLFIATHNGFYVIENSNKKQLFTDMFWSGLYPNSIAVLDFKNVYLGMRGGIAKLNLDSKETIFYKHIKTSIQLNLINNDHPNKKQMEYFLSNYSENLLKCDVKWSHWEHQNLIQSRVEFVSLESDINITLVFTNSYADAVKIGQENFDKTTSKWIVNGATLVIVSGSESLVSKTLSWFSGEE